MADGDQEGLTYQKPLASQPRRQLPSSIRTVSMGRFYCQIIAVNMRQTVGILKEKGAF
jgi:hypothetical protein